MRRFLLFLLLPLADLALLMWTAGRIGVWWTVAIVVGTAVLGSVLVKRQGLAVWSELRSRLAAGSIPAEELAHGAMLVAAGAFLLAPGLLTDLMGLVLLIPAVREWLRRRIARRYTDNSSRAVRVDVWR